MERQITKDIATVSQRGVYAIGQCWPDLTAIEQPENPSKRIRTSFRRGFGEV
jgi:hypothetical protein